MIRKRVLGVWLACAAAVCRAGPAASQDVALSVQDGNGVYRVEGSFSAAVSPADAWSVLSDYDGISSFIPSMKESRVLERRGGHVLVEQRALGKFLFFTRTARVLLLVRENPPGMIAFEDILHYDFEYYRGSWSVERSGGDSRVVYRLEAKRKFPAPEFIAGRIMRRNAEDLLQEVRAEMLRRSRAKRLA